MKSGVRRLIRMPEKGFFEDKKFDSQYKSE
jgi:hypothetical protein